jgi:hypothetical protein
MRTSASLMMTLPLTRPLPDRRLTAWWLWNYSCGGSTAPTAQDSSMLCSVTQTPARLADSSLLAMGSASRAGFFCVSRNLVCTRRGLQRARSSRRLAFKGKGRGKRLSRVFRAPSPFFAFFSTGAIYQLQGASIATLIGRSRPCKVRSDWTKQLCERLEIDDVD